MAEWPWPQSMRQWLSGVKDSTFTISTSGLIHPIVIIEVVDIVVALTEYVFFRPWLQSQGDTDKV